MSSHEYCPGHGTEPTGDASDLRKIECATCMRDEHLGKHPISQGMESEHTTCWREHNPGYVCILPEGHAEGEGRDAATDAAYDAIKPFGTWPMAVNAVEAARPIIIREEQKRLTAMIQNELDNGHNTDAILRWMQAGFAWSVRDL